MGALTAGHIRKAILIGVVSAAITWIVVYHALHQPSTLRSADGSILFLTPCYADDDDLTAAVSATGAYIATFTSIILLLAGRTPKNVFTRYQL